jgi:beta-lactamase regulating signal transducer with metallopeptidase domain
MIDALASHLWQSTWFAGAAALLALVLRGNRARVRYWIWLSASTKFLVPFAVLIGVGGRFATPVRVPIVVERVAVTMAGPVTIAEVTEVAPLARVSAMDWRPMAMGGVWIAGFAVIAAMRFRAWRRVRAAVRASRPMEIAVGVEVRSAPGLLEPGVVGLLRPVLLLPDGIVDRLTAEQLESVMAHELCHVRRRDNLFAALHMVVEAVFWFHPVVWWIGARLVEERERACDEGVLSLGGEPRAYAEAILGVCKLYVESPLACVSGVTGADLRKRVEAIMTNRIGLSLSLAKKLLLTSAGAAALVGPVAMGVVIGTTHLPVLHAQVATPQAPPVTRTQRATPAAEPAAPSQDRRLLTLLFDCGAMTADEQERARRAAIEFVSTKLQQNDALSIMQASNGKLTVVQDYTSNGALLQSAIAGIGAQGESGVSARLVTLEQAAKMLGAMPGKKSLIYFTTWAMLGAEYQDQVKRAVQAGVDGHVAFYAIDVRGAQPAAPQDQRNEEARAKFGDTSSAKSRTYIRYGQPDQIEDRGDGQIWRYNYLQNFRGRAEFEFQTGNRMTGVKILWPPPTATFEGKAADGVGLPSRHASIETYPGGERQVIKVPLDGLTGRVEIAAGVRRVGAGGDMVAVANLRDSATGAAIYDSGFMLEAGSYEATVLVWQQVPGKQYEETIRFQVM